MDMMRKRAFTIAELVVAMIIIGTIAIILMPILVTDNEKQVLKASLEKSYSNLKQVSQAVPLFIARGKISSTSTNSDKFFAALRQSQKLMRKQDEYLANYELELGTNIIETVVLRNGVIVMLQESDRIVVDVNGIKRPNLLGRDIYFFELDDNDGNLSFDCILYDETNCKKDGIPINNLGCADFVLNHNGKP